jgi:hypothetical protein
MNEKWEAMTVRFPGDEKAELELAALVTKESMNDIIREATRRYLNSVAGLDRVKAAVAEARSEGPPGEPNAPAMGESVASADENQGLGPGRAADYPGKPSREAPSKPEPAETSESAVVSSVRDDNEWLREVRRQIKEQRARE